MKLCAVTQSYAATGGGGRTVLNAEREWCEAQGIEHVLIVPGPEDGKTVCGLSTTYTIGSPRVPGSPQYRLLLRSGAVAEILRQEMPDIIETHCPYNLPWAALRHRRRYGGLVTALYMTDVSVVYVEQRVSQALGRPLARVARAATELYLRTLYNRCDAVVATSTSMQRRLMDIGARNPHYVPLGVDLDTFSPAQRRRDLRCEMGATDGDLLLVYAGRMDQEKRPDLVLEAFSMLPQEFGARLVLVGDGPMRAELEARAAQVGRTKVLPFLPDRDGMARLLASADVYVSAMAHETFGLSVVEAQACGLPVLGVRAGAMLDRVREISPDLGAPPADGFLVDLESPAQMARRIVETPREVWRALGENARERVRLEFSWDRTFQSLISIYTNPAPRRVSRGFRAWLPRPHNLLRRP